MKTKHLFSIDMKYGILVLAFFLMVLPGIIHAQNYFEGSVTYNITLSGDDANAIMENNPPKKMDMHVKDDNFIIQLYEARVPRTFLFIGDSSHTFGIDGAAHVYYLRDYYRDTIGFVPMPSW